jgi:hypothetical protein
MGVHAQWGPHGAVRSYIFTLDSRFGSVTVGDNAVMVDGRALELAR